MNKADNLFGLAVPMVDLSDLSVVWYVNLSSFGSCSFIIKVATNYYVILFIQNVR